MTQGLRRLRPAAVLAAPDRLLRGAVLEVRGGRITALRAATDGVPVEDFPGELWAAAPLMLHAHLESHDAPSAAWPRDSFAAWASALVAWRASQAPGAGRATPEESARRSLRELGAHGCGFVLASAGEPAAVPSARSAVAGHADEPACVTFPELFEPDPARAGAALADALSGALSGAPLEAQRRAPAHPRRGAQAGPQHEEPTGRRSGAPAAVGSVAPEVPGLALHAPFSVSVALARGVFDWAARDRRRRVSIHLGEHAEERLLLADQAGPLAELLRARGRSLPEARWASPLDWLETVAPGPRPELLAVHAGDLSAAELRRLRRKRVSVVWCPGTHRWFDRPRPAFADAGLPAPCLGCDSRASNDRLDPFAELEHAAALLPEYPGSAWWTAVTVAGAAALGLGASWGSLLPGRRALPLRLPDPGLDDARRVCDSLVAVDGPRPLAPPGLPAAASPA